MDSILYREKCMQYKKYYEEFWQDNFKYYARVNYNFNKLSRKLSNK